MITVDASVVIAHLQPSDRHHITATGYLLDHADEPLLVHAMTLAEILVGGVRSGRARELLGDLEAIGVEVAEPHPDEPLRLATLRAETGLKLPGCCALETAVTTRSTLATFDDRLAAIARQRHLTVGP